jgi:hypothetical protein
MSSHVKDHSDFQGVSLDGLITRDIIDEMLEMDLQGWTPVRGRGM